MEEILLDNKIYLSSPEEFNDPFEVRPQINLDSSEKDREKIVSYYRGEVRKSYGFDLDAAYVSEKIFDSSVQYECWDNVRSEVLIYCLSACNDGILMYSYYADSHSGICLEFDKSEEFFQSISVNYETEFPRVDILHGKRNYRELAEKGVLTKAECWSHEEEYRIVKSGSSSRYLEFNPVCLTGIIFGCRASSCSVDAIKDILSRREMSDVQLYRATPKKIHMGRCG